MYGGVLSVLLFLVCIFLLVANWVNIQKIKPYLDRRYEYHRFGKRCSSRETKKMNKFKKKYVLGEGYPWEYDVDEHKRVGLNKSVSGFDPVVLKFPEEMWSNDVPKYRLILEKI
jgi:hypothetical protein